MNAYRLIQTESQSNTQKLAFSIFILRLNFELSQRVNFSQLFSSHCQHDHLITNQTSFLFNSNKNT